MEIQKVFSDYYDTERMYSVILSEPEMRLYGAAAEAVKSVTGFLKGPNSRAELLVEALKRHQLANEVKKADKALKSYKKGLIAAGALGLGSTGLAAYGLSRNNK